MAVQTLDHFTINTTDLQRSVAFYTDVLGLRAGDRPAFDFPGAWLYCGDRPVVHLIGRDGPAQMGTGTLDHVAFRANDVQTYRERLLRREAAFTERDVPGMPLHQVILEDPNGVTIELNFWEEA